MTLHNASTPAAWSARLDRRTLARALAGVSLACLVMFWIVFAFLGDRVWWSVPIIFGPRWLFALPWFGMLPWLALEVRRAMLPTAIGAVLAIFGLLDWRVGLHRADAAHGVAFRVLELNANGDAPPADKTSRILHEIEQQHPDMVVIAECGTTLSAALQHFDTTAYHFRTGSDPGLCLLSRGAILGWDRRDQRDMWRQYGAGAIIRAVVATPSGPLRVGLVHLATPRQALSMYLDLSEIPKQGPVTNANLAQRQEESELAREWIMQGPDLPTVIAGDFNLPIESGIYRRYWGRFRNAFNRAGMGTGYTKHTSHWGVRIDHILTSDDIGTHDSFVDPDVGSDHRPIIADLVLPRGQRTSTTR